jgi:two-component sensor histidine kinase
VHLVEPEEDLRVREDLVQALAGVHPGLVGQGDRERFDGPELLDHLALLMQPGLTAVYG